ncbi:SpoIIE family protein phosphatase [Paludibacterium paludis]|uniref:PPM-type phosphatase domain-containing protein n=1 Tax=Paludibacterium paludis TaxID=1225769 RepID=A0A918UBA0_9NEIS|nr:SpoIIE family protein phosphatase [Paludibacterium paludis]GGY22021.1 hypothetical protein GCM10011289_27260 [Paludibacterium paludis]
MRILAQVSAPTRAALRSDPWLNGFDWHFREDGLASYDLLIVEEGDIPAHRQGPVWMFGGGLSGFDCGEGVEHFPAPVDMAMLSDRLLALMWTRGQLLPACLARLPLMLENGALSMATRPSAAMPRENGHFHLRVAPLQTHGGDMALRVDLPDQTVLALCDAIGHGEEAGLDCVLFALQLAEMLPCMGFGPHFLRALDRAVGRCLERGRFVAAGFLCVDWRSGRVRIFNAGMPDTLMVLPGRPVERFASEAPPFGLGMIPESVSFRSSALQPCSHWVMSSDGVDDAALGQEVLRAGEDCLCGVAGAAGSAIPVIRTPLAEDDASHILFAISRR